MAAGVGATVNGWAGWVSYAAAVLALAAIHLWCVRHSAASDASTGQGAGREPGSAEGFVPQGYGVWFTGRCGLYCEREEVRVTAFRTVTMPWGRTALFGCVPCLRRLIDLERAGTRQLTAPFRTPISAQPQSPPSHPPSTTTTSDPSDQNGTTPELTPGSGALVSPPDEVWIRRRPTAPLWCPGRCHEPAL
ncbi:hypothetical protein E0L36_19230 [Streptomyces sp. AJS327]|uniref:hypothetical protein n=1 Tax=Streptomyces sp. AJS327 TaxID=2545265 RepID=UPI0015DF3528|nr:hypothetical protein [Streptomyces sp. AJS327]MBA0052929.1 hypothetical protein [Streptomyces sp. AJS327]